MSAAVTCPWCSTVNDRGEKRCRQCGRDLPRNADDTPLKGSIDLQQVLGGEVYSAVVREPSPSGRNPVDEDSNLPIAQPRGGGTPVADLALLTERISTRAAAAGQRFKPYSADRPRIADTNEAKKAVSRQLDSAARAFREKRFDRAIEHLLKAIAKEDADPRSWILLGEAYLRLERPYKAAVGYLRALDLDPPNENAALGLARTLRSMEDLADALEILNRAVESNPAMTEGWAERGMVLEALDRPVEAAQSFQKALELRPDHILARARFIKLSSKAEEAAPDAATASPQSLRAARDPAGSPTVAPDEEELPDFADLAEPEHPKPVLGPAAGKTHPARMRTFVKGLDETLDGGIPWGHVLLVEGAPGTMKSSLAFSILAQNAAHEGMHCLYLSFGERTSSLLKQMGSLGLPLHVSRGSLVVLDPRAAKGLLGDGRDWVDALRAALHAIKAQRGLDIVVIDSLETLGVLARFKDRPREIFRLFEWLRDLDITSFVISERPDHLVGHTVPAHWDEDYLADSVFQLQEHVVSDRDVERRLRIVKMRGTKHRPGFLEFVLDEGQFRLAHASGR